MITTNAYRDFVALSAIRDAVERGYADLDSGDRSHRGFGQDLCSG